MAFETSPGRRILTADRRESMPIPSAHQTSGVEAQRNRPSNGHAGAYACRWPDCGCTSAAGAGDADPELAAVGREYPCQVDARTRVGDQPCGVARGASVAMPALARLDHP